MTKALTAKALTVSLACAALALAAGCGSSGSSTTTATVAGASAATATSPSAPATSKSAAASKAGASKTGAKEGLHYDTTPKYASPSSSEPVQGGTVQIAYRNIAIDPDTVRVKVGSTVKWTNYDPVEHNVTSKSGPISFASGTFSEGKTFEVKMTKPGVIHYECTIHPTTMNGTIEVVK
jgi:plastocyanin